MFFLRHCGDRSHASTHSLCRLFSASSLAEHRLYHDQEDLVVGWLEWGARACDWDTDNALYTCDSVEIDMCGILMLMLYSALGCALWIRGSKGSITRTTFLVRRWPWFDLMPLRRGFRDMTKMLGICMFICGIKMFKYVGFFQVRRTR
eukprot:SAG11_NODE_474_length_9142_cov_6.507907_12_plen_148_part_00